MSPDYPRPTIDVEAIWTYTTRTLTGFTGTPRVDLIGVDASFEASTGARASRIDAPISSRAAPGDAMSVTSAGVSAIWAATTRTLTGFTGTPRSDLIGVDASFEASTGTRATRIDRLSSIEAFDTPVEGTATFLVTDTYPRTVTIALSEVGVKHCLECYVDLSALASGETLRVDQYMSIVTPVSYKLYARESYTGVQELPMLFISTKPARYGLKIDLYMPSPPAANRSFPWQWFRKRVV